MRVMLIDDDSIVREMVRMSLGAAPGFEVTTRNNAHDALKGIPDPAPDLFLIDLAMPDIGGFELLSRLRAMPALAEIPAIFLTARSSHLSPADVRSAGALGVITKPVDPTALPGQIRGLLMLNGTAAE